MVFMGRTIGFVLLAGLTACTGSSGGGAGVGGSAGSVNGSGGTASGGASSGSGTAAELARKLGRANQFLIGLGNDGSEGFTSLGVTFDLHYMYLTQGWTTWNANGGYADIVIDASVQGGAVPMFSYYGMAGQGDGNVAAMQDAAYMAGYWDETTLLFERIAAKGTPAIVHLEADFWEYVRNASGSDPTFAAQVKINSRCSDLPDDVSGMGRCLVRIARQVAPQAIIGFHASAWSGWDTGNAVGGFLAAIGGSDADLVVVETLDRDAGCFEAQDAANNCLRDPTGMYWSDAVFASHLDWVKAVSTRLGVPALWWQTPLGVPSDTPGGTPGHYRDNRVKYFFEHVPQLVAANGLGAAFGVGAGGQTYIDTDGDQFKNAVTAYLAAPTALP
jgi:hypothetical protein